MIGRFPQSLLSLKLSAVLENHLSVSKIRHMLILLILKSIQITKLIIIYALDTIVGDEWLSGVCSHIKIGLLLGLKNKPLSIQNFIRRVLLGNLLLGLFRSL